MTIDVIRLAREAGMFTHKEVQPEIERFAALVAAEVMEEDAKVCETVGNHNITAACAAAIRARKPA